MKLQYFNANAHKNKPEIQGLSVGCVNEMLDIINKDAKNKPDIIVITEFSYLGDYERLWGGLAEYEIEVSNKNRNSEATCLVLIAWKKVLEGVTVSSDRPPVVRDRFLMIDINEEVRVIGLHVPPPYARFNTSLIDRVKNEIEPFRNYVDDIAVKFKDNATIIIGDFNPYNSETRSIKLLKESNPHVNLTDNILNMTSLYDYTSVFDMKLDFICISQKFIVKFGKPEVKDIVKMDNSDHEALSVTLKNNHSNV